MTFDMRQKKKHSPKQLKKLLTKEYRSNAEQSRVKDTEIHQLETAKKQ